MKRIPSFALAPAVAASPLRGSSLFARALCLALCLALGLGCTKPSEESCRAAIENMRMLLNTESAQTDVLAAIRRCRGGSSREAVECAIKAKTRDELVACKLVDVPAAPGAGSGSATGSGSSN